ncbi:MAG: flagellar motor protein MotB [Magnetospirillum sp.]|nr:flagellar motor protein MotB [Magnetospirillum sp.]
MKLGPNKPAEVDNSWMDTFGDMVSLLLCFFIMLAAISKVDANLYEQVQSGMAKEIGNQNVAKPLQDLKTQMDQMVAGMGADEAVDVGRDDKGLVLNLAAGAMFKVGSAEIQSQMLPVLKEIAETLSNPRFATYTIEIQGHTDDTPMRTGQYPTNWDLSSARALTTLKAFAQLGMAQSRMRLAALADVAPRAPNRSPDGNPYPENQALNRRIEVHVYPR